MPTTLPAWLIVAFVAAVALTTLLRVLSLSRWVLRTIGTIVGLAVSACMHGASGRPVPHPSLRFDEPTRREPRPTLTAEQKLRARAEGIATTTGTEVEVVLAALREGGSFPESVEAAAAAA